MLNLEDFTSNITLPGNKLTATEIEAFYREKIEKLEAKHKATLEQAKKEAYKKGYLKGKEETEITFQKKLIEAVETEKQKFNKEIEKLKDFIRDLSISVKTENRQMQNKLFISIVSSLEEIFEYLFINDTNLPVVKEKIEKLIEDFEEDSQPVISVEVNKKTGNFIKNIDGIKIKENNSLNDGDFTIKFKDFSIISKFKEKAEILREEIEREIKKSTSI